ncbi:MAG: LysR family transcriptional regulator [Pseudomonadota bacterium]
MDRLDELSVFLAVVEAGGLAAAGRRLRRSPAAVTRTLAALEARVGARLIERTTRRLSVTEAGRRLADEARRILGAYEAAVEREASGPLRGALRISAPLVFGRRHVAPLVAGFLDDHPQVTAELVLNDRNLDLVEQGIDVALRIGDLADSGLMARKVGEVGRQVVASPAYLARRGAPARPVDLSDHEIVHASTQAGPADWRFERGGRRETIRVRPRLMINAIEAVVTQAVEGRGIARLFSYQVADELADGRLTRLLPEWEPPPMPVHLLAPTGRLMPARVRAFLDFAAARLTALPVIRPG